MKITLSEKEAAKLLGVSYWLLLDLTQRSTTVFEASKKVKYYFS